MRRVLELIDQVMINRLTDLKINFRHTFIGKVFGKRPSDVIDKYLAVLPFQFFDRRLQQPIGFSIRRIVQFNVTQNELTEEFVQLSMFLVNLLNPSFVRRRFGLSFRLVDRAGPQFPLNQSVDISFLDQCKVIGEEAADSQPRLFYQGFNIQRLFFDLFL